MPSKKLSQYSKFYKISKALARTFDISVSHQGFARVMALLLLQETFNKVNPLVKKSQKIILFLLQKFSHHKFVSLVRLAFITGSVNAEISEYLRLNRDLLCVMLDLKIITLSTDRSNNDQYYIDKDLLSTLKRKDDQSSLFFDVQSEMHHFERKFSQPLSPKIYRSSSQKLWKYGICHIMQSQLRHLTPPDCMRGLWIKGKLEIRPWLIAALVCNRVFFIVDDDDSDLDDCIYDLTRTIKGLTIFVVPHKRSSLDQLFIKSLAKGAVAENFLCHLAPADKSISDKSIKMSPKDKNVILIHSKDDQGVKLGTQIYHRLKHNSKEDDDDGFSFFSGMFDDNKRPRGGKNLSKKNKAPSPSAEPLISKIPPSVDLLTIKGFDPESLIETLKSMDTKWVIIATGNPGTGKTTFASLIKKPVKRYVFGQQSEKYYGETEKNLYDSYNETSSEELFVIDEAEGLGMDRKRMRCDTATGRDRTNALLRVCDPDISGASVFLTTNYEEVLDKAIRDRAFLVLEFQLPLGNLLKTFLYYAFQCGCSYVPADAHQEIIEVFKLEVETNNKEFSFRTFNTASRFFVLGSDRSWRVFLEMVINQSKTLGDNL